MSTILQSRSAPSFPIQDIQHDLEHAFISLSNCQLVLDKNGNNQKLLSDLLLEASTYMERALEDMRKCAEREAQL